MKFITINATGLLEARIAVRKVGQSVPAAAAKRIRSALGIARHKLRSEAGLRIGYPVKWDNERQRRAFFASKGFSRGIPTGRSGGYQRGWDVVVSGENFSLLNRYPGAILICWYAKVNRQSSIHMNRWIMFKTVIDTAVADIERNTLTDIKTALRQNK